MTDIDKARNLLEKEGYTVKRGNELFALKTVHENGYTRHTIIRSKRLFKDRRVPKSSRQYIADISDAEWSEIKEYA